MKIGIIGGAGYTGGELLRILIHHPEAEIVYVNSKSQAGKPVYNTHTDLLGDTDLRFSDDLHTNVDVIFLCSGHGESKKFLAANPEFKSVKIVDLSTDYRDQSEGFVYGLAELQRDKIRQANHIANPGCFATSIELALLPLAQAGLIHDDVHVSAVTGSTGAGQSLSPTGHFSWRSNNISIYKAFTHQHLTEIGMVISSFNGANPTVNFIPYRGTFTRGIMANVYTKFSGTLAEAKELYKNYYQSHPFTHVSDVAVDVKQVVNTNKCLISLEVQDGNLLITSIIDNLTKGASGQAVQNMNLMFGLDEKTGLGLKSVGM
ncbi:N-acetyl-gamma-glutamyl-phosphate reductase [Arcicella aurantiaca]|uniref:N-acetyl-gamma-glutamyl-phosphate reductase n=1 Tax=Arcicella aurantiaca TaxID=591202 RepID=A0A316EE43_9BACT|nr:N-acetyl-gamma-glutamyl-phosphate reductase [Arcicella aurantiaca]PWK28325.1 N-acetyl-gamma-glutamyl-phosphate reductase [Arcicella aurantiaca]